MSEEHAEAPPGALAAALLVTLAAGMLPLWDALDRYELLSALAGSGLGAGGGVSFPLSGIVYPALAVLLGIALYRSFVRAPGRAAWVFVGACLWTLGYAGFTAYETATRRSHAIDGWTVCETPGISPSGHPMYVSTSSHAPYFDGPHLPNGDPCVLTAERRGEHQLAHPDGDLFDGMAQIWSRFPDDRARTIWGTLAATLLVVAAGATFVRTRPWARAQ